MSIVRKIKLSKLSGIDYLSDEDKIVMNFVNSKIKDLSEFRLYNYSDIIYYMDKEGKNILQYNKVIKYFAINIDVFLDLEKFKSIYKTNDIFDILQYILGLEFGFEIVKIGLSLDNVVDLVENTYKQGIGI